MSDSNKTRLMSTPQRRLGLSRRYSKSSPLVDAKISPNENLLKGCKRTAPLEESPRSTNPQKIQRLDNCDVSKNREYDSNSSQFSDLLRLIEVWKQGCKDALNSLQACVYKHEDKKLSYKQLSKQLGIWEVLKEHFDDDSELLGSDDSDCLEFEL